MKSLIDIKRSGFMKNFLTLITGTVIAQLIPIGLYPIITRIYSPDDFGLFAVYISIIGILGVISTLRYEMAIVLPKNNKIAANLLAICLSSSFLFSLLLFVLVFLFKDGFASLLSVDVESSNWLYVVPFSVLLVSSYQAMNYWLIRKKAFKSSSINKVARRSSEGATQLLLGKLNFSSGLIIGDVIGNIANNLSGLIQLKKTGFVFKDIRKKYLTYSLKKYSDFPKYTLVPALLNTASLQLPILIINNFYDESVVGYFNLSRQILSIPLVFISLTISQIILQRFSEKKNNSLSIRADVYMILFALGSLGVLELLVVYFFGVELFSFVFGDLWKLSGEFSQILVFGFIIKFIVSPLSIIFIALERIKISAIWQVFYFLMIGVLVLFKGMLIKNFLQIYVAIDFVAYLIYLVIILWVMNTYEKEINGK